MKNLVVVVIGLLVFIGCSKNSKDVSPEGMEYFMTNFDLNPIDTIGLRLFGMATIEKNDSIPLVLLGNKNGKLWVHALKKEGEKYKKIINFIVDGDFKDNIEVDLGYGEKVNKCVDYIGWHDGIIGNSNHDYKIFLHDYKNFAISGIKTIDDEAKNLLSWSIYDNKINLSRIYYFDIITDGYIGANECVWICDLKGDPIYEPQTSGDIFINLFECIKYSSNSIIKQNAQTGKIIWETQFAKMGQVIDGHDPQIEHSMEITGDIISCTFNITNYDGSKETKNFKVNIDTGEITYL